MADETYEYLAVSDRNLDPLAGSDKNSIKMLTDVMNTRHGKGWVYAGIVPLATLKPQLAGRADMSQVSAKVKARLAG